MNEMTNQQRAAGRLREMLMSGDKVWVRYAGANRDGDRHKLALYIVSGGEIRDITSLAAPAIGERYNPASGTFSLNGGGMDMGFEAVYRLSGELFGRERTDLSKGPYALRKENL